MLQRISFIFAFLALFVFTGCQQPATDGPHPLAYGSVDLNGDIYGGTGNFTVAHASTGIYTITITGWTVSIDNTFVTATLLTGATGGFVIYWDSPGGNVEITIRSAGGALTDLAFSFTVWTS